MLGVREEILARAVEQLVCADLGVDCGPVEKWAWVCWQEMLKNERVQLPVGDWLEKQIRETMLSNRAREMTERVKSLKIKPRRGKCNSKQSRTGTSRSRRPET